MSRGTRLRGAPGFVAVLAVVAVLVAAHLIRPTDDETPESAARAFLTAWDDADASTLARYVDDAAALLDATIGLAASLDADFPADTLGRVTQHGDDATATAGTTVDVRGFGRWTYEISFDLRRDDGDWQVVWTPGIVAPGLRADAAVVLTRTWPERAPILGAGGAVLVGATPGLIRAPPSPTFARHVLGRTGEITTELLEDLGPPYRAGDTVGLNGIEAHYERQLAGTPTATIEVVGADRPEGRELLRTLHTFPGTAPVPVTTTLDVTTQLAAESALGGVGGKAAVVAVDSAGAVRAVASRPLDDGFNRALNGTYAPGSAFEIVTATALLKTGYDTETPLPCDQPITVDGEVVRNVAGGTAGMESFSTVFAESCRTGATTATSGVPATALEQTAVGNFGFNTVYDVGVPSVGGIFPRPASPAEKTAASIGQARVQASPLHLASVAATVAGGTWHRPFLTGGPPQVTPATWWVTPDVRLELDRLMRRVVTEGTGAALRGIEGARGKSGSATFGTADPPRTNAWFLAYRGDLGLSVLVEEAPPGSGAAEGIAATFFTALGP